MWSAVILIWSLIGIVGVVLSVASLRVATAKRRMVPANRPLLLMASTHIVRSAWSRIALFAFLVLNGPLVNRMFDIPPRAGIGDQIDVNAPFGVVLASGAGLTLAGAIALWLLVADTKDLLR